MKGLSGFDGAYLGNESMELTLPLLEEDEGKKDRATSPRRSGHRLIILHS